MTHDTIPEFGGDDPKQPTIPVNGGVNTTAIPQSLAEHAVGMNSVQPAVSIQDSELGGITPSDFGKAPRVVAGKAPRRGSNGGGRSLAD